MNDSYTAALHADQNGTLTEWLIDFLNASGNNSSLAKTLQKRGTFHTGLIEYPISKFKSILGPDHSFLYYEDPEKFNDRAEAMVDAIKAGWTPPPFIVTDFWGNELSLADGAHRMEAMKRLSVKSYPTVLYFQNQRLLEEYLR